MAHSPNPGHIHQTLAHSPSPGAHLLICTAVVDDNVGHRSHTRLADCLVKLDELLLVAILGVQVVQLALGMCTSIDQQQPVSGVKMFHDHMGQCACSMHTAQQAIACLVQRACSTAQQDNDCMIQHVCGTAQQDTGCMVQHSCSTAQPPQMLLPLALPMPHARGRRTGM